MGGSAASCVAALVAANALLAAPIPLEDLYTFALEGEAVSSGSRHGDNIGPTLVGGLVLAAHGRLVRIVVPDAWHSVVVHPEAILETRRAREVLTGTYELEQFVEQSANLALVLSGCHRGDAELVRAGLADVLVEPRRAPLIRGFHAVAEAALEQDAMGSSISGAGPSVFAWFETRAGADAAAPGMRQAFERAGFASQAYVSPINGPAAVVLA
jgi:homoserine kinase